MLIENIKPKNEHVLVEVSLEELEETSGVIASAVTLATKTNIEFYYGVVLGLGNEKAMQEYCPNLRVNDKVVFSQFAGYHLDTPERFCKIVTAYDIVAKFDDIKNMNEHTIHPTADRLLVKIVHENLSADGIYVSEESNAREAATQKAVVISCGPKVKEFLPAGTVILFDPYAGNLIVNKDYHNQLKTIRFEDILCTL
jgi:co-chaperonin GroES (HSP10)